MSGGPASSQSSTRIEQLAPELERIISPSEPIKHLADGFGGVAISLRSSYQSDCSAAARHPQPLSRSACFKGFGSTRQAQRARSTAPQSG